MPWAVAPGLSPFVTLRRRTIGGSASTSRSPLGPPSPGMNLDLTFYGSLGGASLSYERQILICINYCYYGNIKKKNGFYQIVSAF